MGLTQLSIALASGVTFAMAAAFTPAFAAPVKNIVIVHGALADGSGWRKVFDDLTGKGYNVTIVQPPMTSLEDDVAATKRILDELKRRGVLAQAIGAKPTFQYSI